VVDVLVILDGASEPVHGSKPTSLEQARTPVLDALCAGGRLSRVRTVAPWLPAGSESAIPALLGWTPPAPVDRGMVEAAAHEIPLAPGERARRVDVLDRSGARAGAAATARAAADLSAALAPRHAVHHLTGHRLLVTGPDERRFPFAEGKENVAHPPADGRGPLGSLPAALAAVLWLWPQGAIPPRVLDPSTVVVAARGAAAGLARLMGARVVVPAGATGCPDTDLRTKAAAAATAMDRGAMRVVVHVGAPDEAAHERDGVAKVVAIERIDRELLAPLAAATRRAGGTLAVTPDHGCDPATGAHDADPVPCLDWPAAGVSDGSRGALAGRSPLAARPRLTERAVASLPVTDLTSGPAAEAA
jgi:2,3-bisphosphoglycerate-independent phosphoglycerate mutase